MWFAIGLLASLIFAALVLAAQEWDQKAAHPAKEYRQTSGAALVNANPGGLSKLLSLNAESSAGELASGPATTVDHRSIATSALKNPFAWMETPKSAQTPVLALTHENDQPSAQANASPGTSVRRQDSAQVIRPKAHNLRKRSSARPRFTDVKMRLLGLWHQSLERNVIIKQESPRGGAKQLFKPEALSTLRGGDVGKRSKFVRNHHIPFDRSTIARPMWD